ncbi:DNA damage-inducible protein D [Candidatus Curtissbacteria bacterium]|nr:DNA damage-inducible protein D [Candidatus Curtissbacteria bacterium]
MSSGLNQLQSNLESLKKTAEDLEYWSARELMPMLGYTNWEGFKTALNRARESCQQTGQVVSDHFRGALKMVDIGSGTKRAIEDLLLTRYACYLVAQNGDPRKPQIAAAQRYFVVKTRMQEVWEQRAIESKRLEERDKLRDTEKKIERTVYQRGITQSFEFATFKNKHIEALYGGINTPDLKKRRGIQKDRALADFDTDVELKAKSFALGMTDHNIRTKDLVGRDRLEHEVIANSTATRNALLARGIIPENLEPEEDIKKIEKRRAKELHALEATGSHKAIEESSRIKELERQFKQTNTQAQNKIVSKSRQKSNYAGCFNVKLPQEVTRVHLSKLYELFRDNPGITTIILEVPGVNSTRQFKVPFQVNVTDDVKIKLKKILNSSEG